MDRLDQIDFLDLLHDLSIEDLQSLIYAIENVIEIKQEESEVEE